MANKRLGEILRNLRNEHNLTQQQVANMLGLKNKSTLGSWEVGKSEPDGYTFLKLCSLYGVDNIYDTFNDIGDFNVPTSKNTFYTSPEEQQLVLAYRSADEIDKTIVRRALNLEKNKENAAPAKKTYRIAAMGNANMQIDEDLARKIAEAARNAPDATDRDDLF